MIVTDPASAETIKYAANAFLATKLSFINAIAAICEGVGADVNDVVVGMGSDKRIGQDFLRPGPGWGGSCFDGAETCIVRDQRRHPPDPLRRTGRSAARRGRGTQLGQMARSFPNSSRALALTERPYDGDMVHIRTKMGRRLTVTADHPMIVRSADDETTIKLAGELTDDDWLPISLGVPIGGCRWDPIHASMIEAIAPAGLAWRDIILRLTDAADGRALARSTGRFPIPAPLGLPTQSDAAPH